MSRFRHSPLGVILPVCITFTVLLVIWTLIVRFANVHIFLPYPWEVGTAAIRLRFELLEALWLTARAAISGFTLSLIFGTLVAICFSQSRPLRLGCFPYAVILQTIPIVAIAPLITYWNGPGYTSVTLISFMVSVFPIIANVTAGLTSVDPGLVDLFRLNGASRWQQTTHLRIPHAIPDLLTGARTSAGLSVIGAIVGEFFAGSGTEGHGLGYQIPAQVNNFDVDEAFAFIAMAVLLGVTMFASVSLVRMTVLARWCDARD